MKEKLLKVFDKAADKTAARKPTSINVFFSHDSYYYNLIPLTRSEKLQLQQGTMIFSLTASLSSLYPLWRI